MAEVQTVDSCYRAMPCFDRPMMLAPSFFQQWLARPFVVTPQREAPCNTALCEPLAASLSNPVSEGVQIIPVQGIMMQRATPLATLLQPVTTYDQLHTELEIAANASDIHTIILDLDSPGGEVGGLFSLGERLYQLRQEKKVIAWVNESALSAAYLIAAATGCIALTASATIGSIGVILAHVDQSAYDKQHGLQYTLITAGDHKGDGNPHQPLSDTAKTQYQESVNYFYELFIQHIATYRQLSLDEIRTTQARCFLGQHAIDQQLADTLLPFNRLASYTQLMSASARSKNCQSKPATTAFPFNSFRSINMSNDQIPSPLPNNDTEKKPVNDAAAVSDNRTCSEVKTTTLADRNAYRKEVLALCRLCQATKRPHKLMEFIEQDIRLEAAKEMLLAELSEDLESSDQTIVSQQMPHHMTSSASPLISLAKERGNHDAAR